MKHFSTIAKDTIPISGVWLRTVGGRVQLLVEFKGKWRLVIDEALDGDATTISHITELEGINLSPVDS